MPSRRSANEVSLNAILEMLQRRKRTVLIAMTLATAAAALYAFARTDQYRAEVLMSVEPAAAQDYLRPVDGSPPANIQEKLWLIRESLFNPTVVQTVIEEFHLSANESPAEQWWVNAIRNTKAGIAHFLKKLNPRSSVALTDSQQREELQERVKSRIDVRVEAADAFSIGFEAADRVQATDAANRLAELLVQNTARASEQRAGSAAGFLETEVSRVKAALDEQRERIQGYQRSAADQLPEQMTANLKLLETLEGQLLIKKDQISDEQARRAAVVEEMKELASQGILEAPAALSPAAAKLETQKARLNELRARYTPQHPEIKAAEAEIRDLERAVAANPTRNTGDPTPARLRYMQLKAEQEAIDRRLTGYQQQQQALAPQIAGYRSRVNAAPEHERRLKDMTRDYDETRAQYQSLLEKQNRAQLEERLEQTTQSTMFSVVRPAQYPLEPFAPKRGRIILLGLLSGLVIGLFVAMFAEYRDTTYKTAEDFQTSVSLPVLGIIPALPGAVNGKAKSASRLEAKGNLSLAAPARSIEQTITLREPRSISSEQYGYLSMQLRQLLGEQSSRVVAITSAAGGEGKTITSINLGVMLSRTAPGRVLLVDCDLRKPRVHDYLGVPSTRGLTDLLLDGDMPLSPCLRRVEHLTVLPCGPTLPNPLEALSSGRTRSLFEMLRRDFQYIVVDLPPILPIADSQIISRFADAVILVVRANQTRRELLEHALERFKAPNVLGAVLNGVEVHRSSYAYAYDYYAQEYLGEPRGKAESHR
jgi:capsular exopolysaccharide synthesis family protein